MYFSQKTKQKQNKAPHSILKVDTRDVFYVRRVVDLMKTVKVNVCIMYIFGKIELLSIHATSNYFKMHYFNDFQEAKTYLYIRHWKFGRNMTLQENGSIAIHSF